MVSVQQQLERVTVFNSPQWLQPIKGYGAPAASHLTVLLCHMPCEWSHFPICIQTRPLSVHSHGNALILSFQKKDHSGLVQSIAYLPRKLASRTHLEAGFIWQFRLSHSRNSSTLSAGLMPPLPHHRVRAIQDTVSLAWNLISSLFIKKILTKQCWCAHLVVDVSEPIISGENTKRVVRQAAGASLLRSPGPKLAGTCVGIQEGATPPSPKQWAI